MTTADLAKAFSVLKRFNSMSMKQLTDPVVVGTLQGEAYSAASAIEWELMKYPVEVVEPSQS